MLQNDIKPDLRLEPSWSKPKQGWKETTLYSVHRGDGQPPVTKVFTKSGEGRHPMLSTTYTSQNPGRSKGLSSQLERLLAEVPSAQQGAPGGKASSRVTFGPKTQRPDLDKVLFKASSNQLPAKEPLSAVDGKIFC